MSTSSIICAICIENFNDEEIIIKTDCSHFFHEKCIYSWYEKSRDCPICRRSISLRFKEGSLEEWLLKYNIKNEKICGLQSLNIMFIHSKWNSSNILKLYLGNNQIKEIPSVGLTQSLQELYLYNNQIKEIPSVGLPQSLQILYLGNNQIKEIPSVGLPQSLQILYLYNNQIKEIPSVGLPQSLQIII